jgi:hypothetical protein
MTLSLMRIPFNEPEVQGVSNNRERDNDLEAVKKFIYACHIVSCARLLQHALLVYREELSLSIEANLDRVYSLELTVIKMPKYRQITQKRHSFLQRLLSLHLKYIICVTCEAISTR